MRKQTIILWCDYHQVSPLPEDLRRFVEDPKSKGTVYLAFGSLVSFNHAPERILRAFRRVAETLPEFTFDC